MIVTSRAPGGVPPMTGVMAGTGDYSLAGLNRRP